MMETKSEVIRRYVQLDLNATPRAIAGRIKKKEGVHISENLTGRVRAKYLESIGRLGKKTPGILTKPLEVPVVPSSAHSATATAKPSANGHASQHRPNVRTKSAATEPTTALVAKSTLTNVPVTLSERLRTFLGAVEQVGGMEEARKLLDMLKP